MIRRLFCPGLLDTGALGDGLWAILDGLVNYYVIRAPAGLICIDTGWRESRARSAFESLHLDRHRVGAVFLTHVHWDHALAAGTFPRADLFVGDGEIPAGLVKRRLADRSLTPLADGQSVAVAGVTVQAIHTPGHTGGSMSYLVGGRWLFTGDAIRIHRGRVVPSLACFNQDGGVLKRSIERLASIEGTETLLMSHGGLCQDPEGAFDRWRIPAAGACSRWSSPS